MEKTEITVKLEEMQTLYNEYHSLHSTYEELPKKYIDIIDKRKNELGSLPAIPSVFSNMPVFTHRVTNYHKLKSNKKSLSIILLGLLCATVVFAFLFFNKDGNNETLSNLTSGFALAAGVAGYMYYNVNKEYKKAEKVFREDAKSQADYLNRFDSALKNFEEEKIKGFEAAKAYRKVAEEKFNDVIIIEAQYIVDSEDLEKSMSEIEEKISSYDFMPTEYHHLIPSILSMLKSGRADEYKEALNMAIAEEKDEQERSQRIAEEERRTRVMQRQAEEEMRHNREMEARQAEFNRQQEEANRQQAEHNRAMEKAESDRAKREQAAARAAAERERSAAAKARHDESYARAQASERCKRCKNYGKCGVPIPNCASFVPR